jgi:hypothetical protein
MRSRSKSPGCAGLAVVAHAAAVFASGRLGDAEYGVTGGCWPFWSQGVLGALLSFVGRARGIPAVEPPSITSSEPVT